MYPQEIVAKALIPTFAESTAEVLTAAAAAHGGYHVMYPIMVSKFMFSVTTATSDLTASVIRLTKVSQANVTTAITSMTVPNGAAVRKVYAKDFSPVKCGVGDLLQLEHLTQGGLGGTPAGAGYYGFVASLQPENFANETNATVL
jgi:hypothetical protein